jgi:hypothetical protein
MKNIIIKETAKPHISNKNFDKVVAKVTKADKPSGVIGKIKYLISTNSIILF